MKFVTYCLFSISRLTYIFCCKSDNIMWVLAACSLSWRTLLSSSSMWSKWRNCRLIFTVSSTDTGYLQRVNYCTRKCVWHRVSLMNFCVQQYFPFTNSWNFHIGICTTHSPPQIRIWTHGHDHILTAPSPQKLTNSLENFYTILFQQHNTIINEQFQKVENPIYDLIYDIWL